MQATEVVKPGKVQDGVAMYYPSDGAEHADTVYDNFCNCVELSRTGEQLPQPLPQPAISLACINASNGSVLAAHLQANSLDASTLYY